VREKLQLICFKLILKKHKIPCDSVMKRHLRPCCPFFKRPGGNASFISPLSGVPEITYDAVM